MIIASNPCPLGSQAPSSRHAVIQMDEASFLKLVKLVASSPLSFAYSFSEGSERDVAIGICWSELSELEQQDPLP